MPSIETLRKKTEEFFVDVAQFKATDYGSDIRLLARLADIMTIAVGVILPQTNVVRGIVIGIKTLSAIIKKYARKRDEVTIKG